MIEKTCPRCSERKALTEFGHNRATPDGKAYYCLTCAAEVQREWKYANADKVREWKRRARERAKNER